MSTISDKLNIIKNAKNDIKSAIENKGVSVGDVGIQEYASKINEMQVATPVSKGIIINTYDNNGYVTDLSIVGLTTIPDYYLGFDTAKSFLNYNGFNLQLPNELTEIGQQALYNCNGLMITSLPESVTKIGTQAFYQCSKLALSKLPDNLTELGNSVFQSCSKLALTSLPNKLTSIPSRCFQTCMSLPLTSLPSDIELIGTYAFSGCSKIKIKELPSKITNINMGIFQSCTGLTEMTCLGDVTTIGANAFSGCKNLTKFVLPNITSVPTLSNSNAFMSTPIYSGTGYVYFPDALVEEAKSKTNWSDIASQIKGVSEL